MPITDFGTANGQTWGPAPGSRAEYFKDPVGCRVYLRGSVSGGDVAGYVFRLPVGYQPQYTAVLLTGRVYGGYQPRIAIDNVGEARFQNGGGRLDGLSFRVATEQC